MSTNKIINTIIFAIAGIGCLLALWFSVGFDEANKELYYETNTLKSENPAVLEEFSTLPLDQLPAFVQKNNDILDVLNGELKTEQLQKDILYTFITQLKDLDDETAFEAYKADFAASSALLFAKSEQADSYKNRFNALNTFSELQPLIQSLDDEYVLVKQDFLVRKGYKVDLEKFNKRCQEILDVVSDAKRTLDFETLQASVASYKSEGNVMNWAMIFTYIIFFVALGSALFFLVFQLAKSFRSSYKTLLGVVAICLVFIIAYFISSDVLSTSAIKEGLTGHNVKMIGAGMITTYVLFFGAIASIFVSMLINKFKKS